MRNSNIYVGLGLVVVGIVALIFLVGFLNADESGNVQVELGVSEAARGDIRGDIVVVVPNGGELWRQDSLQTIYWTARSSVRMVHIYIDRYNEKDRLQERRLVQGNVAARGGQYAWRVFEDLPDSAYYKISIVDAQSATFDQSDRYFTISAVALPLPPIPSACATDADCDDGVSCTVDVCAHGSCVNVNTCTPTPSPTPSPAQCRFDVDCQDGNRCNGWEACVNGACQAGTGNQGPVQCPPQGYSNVCTANWRCVSSSSSEAHCEYDTIPGCCYFDVECQDGNRCNGWEDCNDTTHTCQSGTGSQGPVQCPAGQVCVSTSSSQASCQPAS